MVYLKNFYSGFYQIKYILLNWIINKNTKKNVNEIYMKKKRNKKKEFYDVDKILKSLKKHKLRWSILNYIYDEFYSFQFNFKVPCLHDIFFRLVSSLTKLLKNSHIFSWIILRRILKTLIKKFNAYFGFCGNW